MSQHARTLQECRTTLAPEEVIRAAKAFFARQSSLYAAFVDREGPRFATLRGQGGEEIAIAAVPDGGATHVTGSTYLFDMQLARFFATLPPAESTLVSASAPPAASPALSPAASAGEAK